MSVIIKTAVICISCYMIDYQILKQPLSNDELIK